MDVYLTKRPGYRMLLMPGSRYDAEVYGWQKERDFTITSIGTDVMIPGAEDPLVAALVETSVSELLAAELWRRHPDLSVGCVSLPRWLQAKGEADDSAMATGPHTPAMVVALIGLGVSLSGTAYAATGGNFLLGKANTADKVSTLSDSAGVALKLNSPSGVAPLAVNSTTVVKNLNANLLGSSRSPISHRPSWARATPTARCRTSCPKRSR